MSPFPSATGPAIAPNPGDVVTPLIVVSPGARPDGSRSSMLVTVAVSVPVFFTTISYVSGWPPAVGTGPKILFVTVSTGAIIVTLPFTEACAGTLVTGPPQLPVPVAVAV